MATTTNGAQTSIERHVLPNGLVVIAEPMPHMRSVSVGIWVRSGSRRESAERSGIAHFIEHMVFKGTARRTAEEIAREMDSVGGHLDAFTSREQVCFNAKVMDEHLPRALDVLSDMVLRPLFADGDIAKEKQVILEEIKADEDNPESVVHELLAQNFWQGHPLGWPILGRRATVRAFNRADVMDCFRRWYAPNNLVVTAAGLIQPAKLVELLSGMFGDVPARRRTAANGPKPEPHARLMVRHKPSLEQAHIVVAVPSYPLAHPQRYAAAVLNNILGGGMSSRLFQNIRERQGLAYAVFSEQSPYCDAGMLSIYAGTSSQSVERVLRLIAEELRRMKQEPVPADELRRAKDQLKGSFLLSLESTGAHMSSLARQELYFGRFFSVEQVLALLEEVTCEDLQRIAQQHFHPEKTAVTVLGPLPGFRLKRDLLAF